MQIDDLNWQSATPGTATAVHSIGDMTLIAVRQGDEYSFHLYTPKLVSWKMVDKLTAQCVVYSVFGEEDDVGGSRG